jgi:RNA methyltransferase, TrmH family
MDNDVICGLNAVRALFQRRPADVLRLFYTEPMRQLAGPLCAQLAERRAPYRELPPEEMQKASGTAHHGGIAAVAKPRKIPFLDIDEPPQVKLLLVLDQVGNPHNLGAIARSAAFFGVSALLLHETRLAAMPSDAVHRTAEGGLEYLDMYRTRDLARALHGLDRHYRTVAATLRHEAVPFMSLPRDRPVALVLGNEERGVSFPVLQACRREVRIEGAGRLQSLNVAQSAAILLQAYTAPTMPKPGA